MWGGPLPKSFDKVAATAISRITRTECGTASRITYMLQKMRCYKKCTLTII